MILVMLGIFIIMIIVGLIIYVKGEYSIGSGFMASGIMLGAITLGVSIYMGIQVSQINVIDEQIAMYQEENTKIEQQIDAAVKQYQDYESGVFAETSSESSITLVSLYPELKSDTLVKKQIEVYMSNNELIKQLKAEKINGVVLRWWLYFGG